MRDDVSVRDATADDLPATASIIASDAGGTVDEWHTRFAEVLADPARLFIVAEADGAVVGFGQARFVASAVVPAEAPLRVAGTSVVSPSRQGIGGGE